METITVELTRAQAESLIGAIGIAAGESLLDQDGADGANVLAVALGNPPREYSEWDMIEPRS